MRQQTSLFQNMDWFTVSLYFVLVILGWLNIYAAVYNEEHQSIFDVTQSYGKQLLWIITALVLAIAVMIADGKFFETFGFIIYIAILLLLISVLLAGTTVSGSKSWFEIGSFRLQPAEFAKFATAMALAKLLSTPGLNFKDLKTKIIAVSIIAVPVGLILLQNDTGSALVYTSFVFVLYREGLSQNVLILGFLAALLFVFALMVDKIVLIVIIASIAGLFMVTQRKNKKGMLVIFLFAAISSSLVFSVDYVYQEVLQEHQKKRIDVLLGKETDLKGAGYNLNQSLIAIGSGGFAGKGYLQGTQTKYDFVPEQSTDFIFCTVGEEWGFIGTSVVIILFVTLMLRILFIAERQKSNFTRIYAYGVASIIFFHFMVNIGMTIGLAPVIGIPLPFFSYGGSSLWAFTILLFILIKLDAYRMQILR